MMNPELNQLREGQLSAHFTLAEFLHSDLALREGIDNDHPPEQALHDMRMLCIDVLEPLRKALGGRPLRITSGYRCPQLNKLLKSADTSQHLLGQAADFQAPGMDLLEVAKVAARLNLVRFDQLIHEGRWLHISWAKKPRRQLLTAGFAVTPPQRGYIAGIPGIKQTERG